MKIQASQKRENDIQMILRSGRAELRISGAGLRAIQGLQAVLVLAFVAFAFASAFGSPTSAQTAACQGETEPALRAKALSSSEMALSDRYLACFPYGDGTISVGQHRQDLSEEAECRAAIASNKPDELKAFILAHSGSDCAKRVAPRLAQLRDLSKFISYKNSLLTGTALRQSQIDDVTSCASSCSAEGATCAGFSFDTGQKLCTLWSSVQGRAPRGNTESGSLAEVQLAAPVAPAVPALPSVPAPSVPQAPQIQMQYGNGVDLPGGDYARYNGMALEQCNALCASSSQCLAFTYNTSAQVCFLKNRIGTPLNALGAISGMKTAVPNAPTANSGQIRSLMSNIDLPNDDASLDYAILRQLSLPDCQRRCEADGQCAAFTYNHERISCILKRGFGQRRMFYGATSGIKQ